MNSAPRTLTLLALLFLVADSSSKQNRHHWKHGKRPPSLRHCQMCRPGHYIQWKCNATHSTICAPCPLGTYASVFNLQHQCTPCSPCASSHFQYSACTRSHDTLCAPCWDKKYYRLETFQNTCLKDYQMDESNQVPPQNVLDNNSEMGSGSLFDENSETDKKAKLLKSFPLDREPGLSHSAKPLVENINFEIATIQMVIGSAEEAEDEHSGDVITSSVLDLELAAVEDENGSGNDSEESRWDVVALTNISSTQAIPTIPAREAEEEGLIPLKPPQPVTMTTENRWFNKTTLSYAGTTQISPVMKGKMTTTVENNENMTASMEMVDKPQTAAISSSSSTTTTTTTTATTSVPITTTVIPKLEILKPKPTILPAVRPVPKTELITKTEAAISSSSSTTTTTTTTATTSVPITTTVIPKLEILKPKPTILPAVRPVPKTELITKTEAAISSSSSTTTTTTTTTATTSVPITTTVIPKLEILKPKPTILPAVRPVPKTELITKTEPTSATTVSSTRTKEEDTEDTPKITDILAGPEKPIDTETTTFNLMKTERQITKQAFLGDSLLLVHAQPPKDKYTHPTTKQSLTLTSVTQKKFTDSPMTATPETSTPVLSEVRIFTTTQNDTDGTLLDPPNVGALNEKKENNVPLIITVVLAILGFFSLGIWVFRYCKKRTDFKLMRRTDDRVKIEMSDGKNVKGLDYADFEEGFNTSIYADIDKEPNGTYKELTSASNSQYKPLPVNTDDSLYAVPQKNKKDRPLSPVEEPLLHTQNYAPENAEPPRNSSGFNLDSLEGIKYIDETTDDEVDIPRNFTVPSSDLSFANDVLNTLRTNLQPIAEEVSLIVPPIKEKFKK